MQPEYYLVDNTIYVQDDFERTPKHKESEKRPVYILNNKVLFENDVIHKQRPIIRLAQLRKEVTLIEADRPEYQILYDEAQNREYKIIFKALVNTKIRLPVETFLYNRKKPELFCEAGTNLILSITISRDKNRTIATLECGELFDDTKIQKRIDEVSGKLEAVSGTLKAISGIILELTGEVNYISGDTIFISGDNGRLIFTPDNVYLNELEASQRMILFGDKIDLGRW